MDTLRPSVRGKVRGHRVMGHHARSVWTPHTRWRDNLVMRQWGSIVSRLLASADLNYKIGGMYVEFVNVASPGDNASVPVYDRSDESGVTYYNGLLVSSDRDYLRVPMVAATVDSSDEALFPRGNMVTFFAQTRGSAGVHGKDFSESSNSLVVGGALVAMPDADDATQDLVLSRFYFDLDEQIPKLDTGQVGLEWPLILE